MANGAPNSNQVPCTTVVGIGASAGGVKALGTLLEGLPSDTGAAFVIIVHLDPGMHSELPKILAAHTDMPVQAVTGEMPLQTDHVYVIPPDRQLQINHETVSATAFSEPRGQRAPIDSFFRSLATHHGDGFAVILTGGGSDGAVGVKAVKEAGGIILVQDPAEAEHPSMPSAAISTEVVDFVLPLKQLAERLADLIRSKDHVAEVQRSVDEEENLRRILAHLRVRTGHDFSHYKRSTVMRRLLRRMQVTRKDEFEDYFSYLRDHVEEAQALLADLLISVTAFFRDPKAFESLAVNVIPHLFRGEDRSPVRVWVAGCATGEEAYSIAMLLMEEAGKHETRPEIQVFGSDMDSRALNIAREGRYPAAIEADVNEERLRRFFTRDGEFYRVKRDLRDAVLFASHSLLKDPPFSRLDLVTCRNLLIYLDRDLQQQVLATLHYGLLPDGYLFLGSSESGEHPEGLFRVVDRDARIYQSAGRATERLPSLPRILGVPTEHLGTAVMPPPVSARTAQVAHREALEVAAPPSALVDQSNRVMHLSENAGRFLQPSGGPLTTDLTDLVRQELRFELRSALHRAFERGEASLSGAISVRFNGDAHPVYLQVRPQLAEAHEKDVKRAVVFFIEGQPDKSGKALAEGSDQSNETVNQLRQELDMAQARLRTMREESEAANEELRAANEELQSINEEYRSTAEELETSKEELQSINEELQTVNSELKLKLETVSRANSDLQNLMAAMDFGTLFLDPTLRIKRFTPRLTDLFSITPGDVGRPITDFTHQLDYDGLVNDARAVLDDLAPIEREIRSRKGGWYLARIRPYRTVDDKIDGVVATFIDVTERRQMEDALRTANEKLEKHNNNNGRGKPRKS
jgi:two-component system CheB/CheR fusion protein